MAEINFNNLYNQLKPMEKRFYDQQFQKKYNPNQENIMLSSQPSYEQMKAVYDAKQQIPEKSFLDKIPFFGSASAAEMPQVPNVSLGTPQINFNTGITGASSAIPNINGVPMINTSAIDQRLQNTDLVNQIIAENQRKLNLANTADTASFFSPQFNNQVPQINNQVPLGFDTSYGVANEEDVEQEFLPDQEPSGIAKLFEFLGKLPTPFNLARRGLGSLRGLNDRMQNSMFGKSKTLAEYFNNRKIAAATGSKDFMNRPRSERNYTGPSGGNNTGGDRGAKGAADSFSNKSGMGRTGY